jgi:hypothetical protein
LNQARDAEIRELIELIEYRPNATAEVLAQRNNIGGYFQGVLSFNRASHPATFELVWAGLRIGQFQALWYKSKFDRARPTSVSPYLATLFDPPGHSSYPSGHAVEAYLVAFLLEQVMPLELVQPPLSKGPLRAMANRVARLREIFAMHFRTDSTIGEKLARESFRIMLRCSSLGVTAPAGAGPNNRLPDGALKAGGLISRARQEWAP